MRVGLNTALVPEGPEAVSQDRHSDRTRAKTVKTRRCCRSRATPTRQRYEAARNLAQARGFRFLPVDRMAQAPCRGMKKRARKTRRRENVEFILSDSTTALKKLPSCQCDETCLHFGTPVRKTQKRVGRKMTVRMPRREIGRCHHDPAETRDDGAADRRVA